MNRSHAFFVLAAGLLLHPHASEAADPLKLRLVASPVHREAKSSRVLFDVEANAGYDAQAFWVLWAQGWRHGPSAQVALNVRWPVHAELSRGLRLTFRYTHLMDRYVEGCLMGCSSETLDDGYLLGGSISYVQQHRRWWWSVGAGALHESAKVNLVEEQRGAKNIGGYLELAAAVGYRYPITDNIALQLKLDVGTLIVVWRGNLTTGVVVTF